MDPNTNLTTQLEKARAILRAADTCADVNGNLTHAEAEHMANLAVELAEHVEALNQWITRGGFYPLAWENGRRTAIQRMERALKGEVAS
jgi:hypothetical protein